MKSVSLLAYPSISHDHLAHHVSPDGAMGGGRRRRRHRTAGMRDHKQDDADAAETWVATESGRPSPPLSGYHFEAMAGRKEGRMRHGSSYLVPAATRVPHGADWNRKQISKQRPAAGRALIKLSFGTWCCHGGSLLIICRQAATVCYYAIAHSLAVRHGTDWNRNPCVSFSLPYLRSSMLFELARSGSSSRH